MANWSETIVELRGSEDKIKKAKDVIEKYIEDNYFYIGADEVYKEFPKFEDYLNSLDDISFRAGFSTMEISRFETEETYIFIGGSGRWCSPSIFFTLLAKKYGLSMSYCDAEAGCNFCYVIEAENGVIIRDEEKNYYSKELVEYLYSDDIDDFIECNDWYLMEDEKENPDIEAVLNAYGASREKLLEETI